MHFSKLEIDETCAWRRDGALRCVLVRPVSYIFGDSANGTSASRSGSRGPRRNHRDVVFARPGYPLTAPVRAVT